MHSRFCLNKSKCTFTKRGGQNTMWLTLFTLQLSYPRVSIITSRGNHLKRNKRCTKQPNTSEITTTRTSQIFYNIAFNGHRDFSINILKWVLRKTCALTNKLQFYTVFSNFRMKYDFELVENAVCTIVIAIFSLTTVCNLPFSFAAGASSPFCIFIIYRNREEVLKGIAMI